MKKNNFATNPIVYGHNTATLVFITAILILVTPCISNSQTNEAEPYKRLVLSTNIFGLAPHFDDATSNFNLHTEYYLGNRKSVTFQVGSLYAFKSNMGNYFFMTGEEIKGFRAELEMRRYTMKKKVINPLVLIFWFHLFQYGSQSVENSGYYYGTNISYASIGILEDPGSDYILRDTYALHAKVGYQCFKEYGLMIDYAIGIGAQYVKNSDHLGSGIMDSKGWNIYPSVQYQLRLGFEMY